MKKICGVLLIFLLFACDEGRSSEYYLLELQSLGIAVKGMDPAQIGAVMINWEYDKADKKRVPISYDKDTCRKVVLEKLHKQEELRKYYVNVETDEKTGVYYIEGGGYGRYMCVEKQYIPDNMFDSGYLTEDFWGKYSKQIPEIFIRSELKDYTIFPLERLSK